MSELKVNKISPRSGTDITLGDSADTITIPSGATLDASNATVTIPAVNLTTGVTGTLPVANGGTNLTSGFANGITEADQFRLTANLTANADPISANLERVDNATFAKIGTGMTLSSGVYTFPRTGLYQVESTAMLTWINDPDSIQVEMYASSDSGSTYDQIARIAVTVNPSDVFALTFSNSAFVNVTDASTFRVKFVLASLDASNYLSGSSTTNYTFFTFTRLGDSQ
jgi:hypothetical protein